MLRARAQLLADLPQRPAPPPAPEPGDRVQTAAGPAVVAQNGTDRVALKALRRLDRDAQGARIAPVAPPAPTPTPPARGPDALALALAAATLPTPGANPVTVFQNQGTPGLSELLNSTLA